MSLKEDPGLLDETAVNPTPRFQPCESLHRKSRDTIPKPLTHKDHDLIHLCYFRLFAATCFIALEK